MTSTQETKESIAQILMLACGLTEDDANDSAWEITLIEETDTHRVWSATHTTHGEMTYRESIED